MYIPLKLAARTHTTYISITKGGGYMLSPLLVDKSGKIHTERL